MRPKTVGLLLMLSTVPFVGACAADDPEVTTGTLPSVPESAAWRHESVTSENVSPTVTSTETTAGEEVRSAFDWLMIARVHCGRRPWDCEVDDLAVPGSPVHLALTQTIDERVRHGIVASDRGSHRHRVTEVVMLDGDRAEVRACHTDDVVLVIGGQGDQPTAVYDESLVSHWSTWTLQKIDSEWRWTDEVVDARIYGEDRCQ